MSRVLDTCPQVLDLNSFFKEETLSELERFLEKGWNKDIPGGFLTNTPQRLVNAFGDGRPINDQGIPYDKGWKTTFWTAQINQSQVSLETETAPMPKSLARLIPSLRQLFSQYFPEAKPNPYTFTMAVCNYYTQPEMNIAAHTDDNVWAPVESPEGNIFASLTFYPQKKPTQESQFARFQIKQPDWKTLVLPDRSLLFLPSGTPHRVKPPLKRHLADFCPRINITFRSVFPREVDPLMNAMAVANHSRYYRLPKAIYYPDTLDDIDIGVIWEAYDQLVKTHLGESSEILLYPLSPLDVIKRRVLRDTYRQSDLPKHSLRSNIVGELLDMVLKSIIKIE